MALIALSGGAPRIRPSDQDGNIMTTQDQIRARQEQRAMSFNLGPKTAGAFQRFAIDDRGDQQALADAVYADQQTHWADPANTRGPNSPSAFSGATQHVPNEPFTPLATPQAARAQPSAFAGAGAQRQQAQRLAYLEARNADAAVPNARNNFNGAEHAQEGAVVRGLDKLLYRRTGGRFVRVAPRSADDFTPTVMGDHSQDGQPLSSVDFSNPNAPSGSSWSRAALNASNRVGQPAQQFDDPADATDPAMAMRPTPAARKPVRRLPSGYAYA